MNKYLAEFIATTFFVYIILLTGNPFAIGSSLAISVFTTAKISGGHVNPAVTFIMWIAGKLPTVDLAPYILAQLSGALAALVGFRYIKL